MAKAQDYLTLQTLETALIMALRQRGYFLGEEGIKVVRGKYRKNHLTQQGWAMRAKVSASTVKRLLKGIPIEKDCLKSCLKALGLKVEDFTFKQLETSTAPGISIQHPVLPLSNPDFYMRVTFSDTNRRQMKYAIEDLRLLLDGQALQISDEDGVNCVTISSDFPESLRDEVETILKHIQSLADKCTVKGNVTLVRSQTPSKKRVA